MCGLLSIGSLPLFFLGTDWRQAGLGRILNHKSKIRNPLPETPRSPEEPNEKRMESRSRREIAAVFFQNELDIEKARKKTERKIAENKLLSERYPFLKPMRGHLKEKKGEGDEDGRGEGTGEEPGPGPSKKRKLGNPEDEERKKISGISKDGEIK